MSRNVQNMSRNDMRRKSKGFLCNLIVLRRRRNSLMKQYRGELEPAVLAQNGRTGAMICQNGDDVLQSISMRKWIGLGRYRQPIFHYGRFVNGIHHGKNGFLLRTLNLDANQSCSLLRLARLDCVIQQVGKYHYRLFVGKRELGKIVDGKIHLNPQFTGLRILLVQNGVHHRVVGMDSQRIQLTCLGDFRQVLPGGRQIFLLHEGW